MTVIMNDKERKTTSNKMRVKLAQDRFAEVQISYIKDNGCQEEGEGTIASGSNQHVQGTFNIEDTIGDYAHIVGNGTSDTNRSNAHTLDWEGNAWFAGDVTGQINENGNITTHILSNKANQSDLNILNNNFNNLTYAASNSVGGPANKVANALSINLQNKEQGKDGSVTSNEVALTYDGSEARSLNLSIVHYNPVVANANAAPGLMTGADKIKLNGIAAGANKYSLPVATASTLGGVKIGSNISIASDGVISAKDTTYSAGAGLNLDTTTFSINNQYSFRQLGWNVDDYNNANDAGVIGFWTQSQNTTDGNGTPTGMSKLPESMWYNLIQFRGNSETKVCFAAQVTSTNDVNPKLYFKTHYHEATGPWMELTSRVYVDSGAKDTYVVFSDIKEDVGLSFRPAHVDGQQIKPYLGTSSYLWAGAYLNNSTVVTSDLNKKKNLEKLSNDNRYIQLFDKIEPYRYKMKNGKSDRYHTGFISQYVESALKECNLTDLDCAFFCKDLNKTKTEETGEPVYDYSLRYEEYIAIMAAKIKSLEKRIQELEKK